MTLPNLCWPQCALTFIHQPWPWDCSSHISIWARLVSPGSTLPNQRASGTVPDAQKVFSRCVVSEPSPSEIQTPLPALTLAMSCFYSFPHTLSVGFSSSLWPWTCLALLSSLLPSGACTLTIAASPFTPRVGSRAYLPLPTGHSLWKGLPCTLHPETSVGAPSGCTPDTCPPPSIALITWSPHSHWLLPASLWALGGQRRALMLMAASSTLAQCLTFSRCSGNICGMKDMFANLSFSPIFQSQIPSYLEQWYLNLTDHQTPLGAFWKTKSEKGQVQTCVPCMLSSKSVQNTSRKPLESYARN